MARLVPKPAQGGKENGQWVRHWLHATIIARSAWGQTLPRSVKPIRSGRGQGVPSQSAHRRSSTAPMAPSPLQAPPDASHAVTPVTPACKGLGLTYRNRPIRMRTASVHSLRR